MTAWEPYQPSADAPWDLYRVHHLHRRAAFGASWPELQRDLADGPKAAVVRLLEGRTNPRELPADFESLSTVIGQSAADSNSPERLKAWWLYRCLFTPHPLEERLTLMWHNHFATSNLKVADLRLMHGQNLKLRKLAFAPFGELLKAMLRDPALLTWLDAPSNRQGHPNENLARELMELFTLGIGHYTERDVQEAARALTGWTVRQGEFRFQAAAHDDGEKQILGQTGKWTGDDLVGILLKHPATARRLAWRLTSEFCGEGVVSQPAVDEFAENLREHNLDIRWGVETILRSELFFSAANIGTRVADPVTFLVSRLRALEYWRQSPSTLVMAEWVRRMGQDLFNPPNVGGWPGGRAWLSARTVVARANCMHALVSGALSSPPRPPELEKLAVQYVKGASPTAAATWFSQLLLGRDTASCSDNLVPCVTRLLTEPQAHLH